MNFGGVSCSYITNLFQLLGTSQPLSIVYQRSITKQETLNYKLIFNSI